MAAREFMTATDESGFVSAESQPAKPSNLAKQKGDLAFLEKIVFAVVVVTVVFFLVVTMAQHRFGEVSPHRSPEPSQGSVAQSEFR
jgi:hypothetical protein